ncbi:hypothetical protein G4B88_025923 [Cannabis sativa]|nr:hypothetical protein G4B88_025923 [Cannabis sativa]
MHVARK